MAVYRTDVSNDVSNGYINIHAGEDFHAILWSLELDILWPFGFWKNVAWRHRQVGNGAQLIILSSNLEPYGILGFPTPSVGPSSHIAWRWKPWDFFPNLALDTNGMGVMLSFPLWKVYNNHNNPKTLRLCGPTWACNGQIPEPHQIWCRVWGMGVSQTWGNEWFGGWDPSIFRSIQLFELPSSRYKQDFFELTVATQCQEW